LESGPITDARGDGDHRHADQTSNYARKSAFHSGTYNYYPGAGQNAPICQQAMNSCDAYIVEAFNLVTHDLCSQERLFGDRNIAGPGGNYRDETLAVNCFVAAKNDGSRQFLILGGANLTLYRSKLFCGDAGSQKITAMLR